MEIWKDIPGYEGYYQASTLGRIRSLDRILNDGRHWKGAIMIPGLGTTGYIKVNLSMNGALKTRNVHRLVSLAFINNPKNKRTINHIDGDKTNNKLYNLEWATHAENIRHSFDVLGTTVVHGENAGRAKLTNENVREIRLLLKTSSLFQREIAAIFGVTRPIISSIKRKITWRSIV